MKRGVLSLALACSTLFMVGADKYEYNDYYYQRKSLFEVLPVDSNNIVFVGNSLTNGGNWNEIFNNPLVINRGISSDVIQGMSDRIELVTNGKPKKIFFLGGVNDISHKVKADSIAKAIEKLVIKIKQETPNSEIYLQSLLPINNDFKRYKNLIGTEDEFPKANILLKEVAKRNNINWIDLYSAFVGNDGKMRSELTNDGLHLNSEGYKIWRNEISKYVDTQASQPSDDLYTITNKDILFVGNSLVLGCEWNELIGKSNIKKRVIGETVGYYSTSIESLVKNKPEKLFLLATYNSFDGNINGDSIVKSLDRTIAKIKKLFPATKIYLQSLTPVNSSYAKYSSFAGKSYMIESINERLRNLAKKNSVKWINLYPVLADDNGELKSEYTNDGYHLMGKGYVAWKDTILKYFK